MSDDIEFVMRFHGVTVYITETAPLRTTKRKHWDEYELVEVESDALCVIVDGKIYIRPVRMQMLDDAGISASEAVSR